MTLLILGGTGVISAETAWQAARAGWDVAVLNRGSAPAPDGCQALAADAHDPEALRAALRGRDFDAVVNFIGYTPAQVAFHPDLWTGRTGQYVYISSTAVYRRPVRRRVAAESAPRKNPYWQYARDKIACEDLLTAAWRDRDFPLTVVRPGHTYGGFYLPTPVSWKMTSYWTVADRLLRGAPVLVPGDGTSPWTVTHAADFSAGLVGLLGLPAADGEVFHITSDEVLCWNEIVGAEAAALGVRANLVHAPAAVIEGFHPEMAGSVLGDKADGLIYDNAKIKSFVPGWTAKIPFARGVRERIEDFRRNPGRQTADALYNRRVDEAAAAILAGRPRPLWP